MNDLEKNNIQFDYLSSNYLKFENDFYLFSNMNIPLTFLTDDILKLMLSTKSNYFRLNRGNSKDNLDHYFIFKISPTKNNPKVKVFEYLGHQYSLKLTKNS